MLFAFSIAPVLVDTEDGSMAHIVARAIKVIDDSGLPYQTDAMFTTVEGEWDEVMPVIKKATEAIADVSPRVSLVLKADLRSPHADGTPRTRELEGKPQRLAVQLAQLDYDAATA